MYKDEEKIIMWLTTFDFMNYKKARFIIDNFKLEHFFNDFSKNITKLKTIFSQDEIEAMQNSKNLADVNNLINNYEKLNIEIVTCNSEKYPELLKQIDSFPILLYCVGDVSLLKQNCLAVVGTRRATRYGKDQCEKFVRDIASEDIVIVSGLADGIDSVAHKTALDVGGKTIAVLGSGVLNIYPSTNIELSKKIIENGGLIISEYKPSEQAATYHFPIRNRIIAGLSKAVFIPEATEKSGSMHTKNYAIDYGREVFALPGRVGDIYSVGCNKCIANGQARMCLSSNEIIEFFGKTFAEKVVESSLQLSMEEQLIYDNLLGEELHFDTLQKNTEMDTKTLQTLLMRMQLKGIVCKLPNNYFKLV